MDLSRRQATMAALGALALAAPKVAQAASGNEGSVEELKALQAAHNKAFTAHDLKGVLATLSPQVSMMGTGPGELWVGHKEASDAYNHFFADFDPGQQVIENLWHQGNVGPKGAWLMTVSKVSFTKGGKKTEFGLNMSIVAEKEGGRWLIRAMHFSNLTGGAKA